MEREERMQEGMKDGNLVTGEKEDATFSSVDIFFSAPNDGEWHPVYFKTMEERKAAMIKEGIIDENGNPLKPSK